MVAQAGTGESHVLARVISTIASRLELDAVLAAVVELLSDASAVHACFVYLLDPKQKRLVLRAASAPYTHLVGEIALEKGEGLAWWALRKRRAAFIREQALDDPRVKYVPELEEERFQSLVAVPLLGKHGDPIGAITLDTEAPREFTDTEVEFLIASASLVAGAIENAQLYDEARTRVDVLEQLNELAEAVAAAEKLETLGPELVTRSRTLLGAERVLLYLRDEAEGRMRLHWSEPWDPAAPDEIELSELATDIGHRGRGNRVAVSLVAGDELLGALVAEGTQQLDLARTVANQAMVAIKKIQVLERLTEKNLIKDLFEDLAAVRLADAENRARRLGYDLEQQQIVVEAVDVDDAMERAVASLTKGSITDRRDNSLRALVPVGREGAARVLADLRRLHADFGSAASIGVSGVCVDAEALAQGFEEARNAVIGAGVIHRHDRVLGYDELGPYKYLLRVAAEPGTRDSTIDAIAKLVEYDRERGAALLSTLEEFLRRRGNISATSDALFVHPNTLRQRLRRIADLTGIDLRRDDWLMVEIALKLVRLRIALATDAPHT
jgi:GAF domain-containing protein